MGSTVVASRITTRERRQKEANLAKRKSTKKAKKAKKSARGRKATRGVKAAARSKKTAAKKTKRSASKKTKRAAPKRKAAVRVKKAPAEQIGEGSYAASRQFQKDEQSFVKKNRKRIPALAKEAEAALEGPEGPALAAAEEEARMRTDEAA